VLNQDSPAMQASGTAMATAFLRALAASDPRADIRGNDSLAEIFLDAERCRPLHDPQLRAWLMQNRIAAGAYEFMIARTAFFDEVFTQALKAGVSQVVLLGAGYDSRPYRFADQTGRARIFELDGAPTQVRKLDCLRAAGVSIPAQVALVAVDFEKDDLASSLLQAGFRPQQTSLFLWEGVTYYLSAGAVDYMLAFVSSHSPAGSAIAFDYAALSGQALKETGARELRSHLQSQHSNEPIKFGIPADGIGTFLKERGFDAIRHLTAAEMREKYLAGSRYPELNDPPSLLCLVQAQVI
jgi:methyltransferase (TIGR00027 family)